QRQPLSQPWGRREAAGTETAMRAAGLALRAIIALAALGMIGSGLVLLGEAGTNLLAAARAMLAHDHAQSTISLVMKTIDECLFAVIITLLGAKVIASFVLAERVTAGNDLPAWIRPSELGELKSTFCQAILVYLIVDFATDMATADSKLDPGYLVLPVAILLIAGALKLMPHGGAAAGHQSETH
ncbi:MAG: YqhA family protein, partial [Bosea sp. (in: a-proteobacteria)]|nr:YqhA family protein [Bosea sp. (in: a-proteobacteria)]